MLYEEVRPLIKSGDVIAFSRRGPISRLIETVTDSDYSHVGIAWVISGRILLLEATFAHGVSARSLSEAGDFTWVRVNSKWSKAKESAAIARLAKNYSVVDALRLGLGIRPSRGGEVCSLYVADVHGLDRDKATPGWIVDHFVSLGGRIERVMGR